MCYIGITGYKNTGRITAAWLLANAIEHKISDATPEEWDKEYRRLVKAVIDDPDVVESTRHCTIDSFGGYILGFIKIFVPTLGPFDIEDKQLQEQYAINPKTFEVLPVEEVEQEELVGAIIWDRLKEGWVTVKDFIIYFADTVMKGHFGDNIWLNVAKFTTETTMADGEYQIFWDVKTDAEYDFINSNGVMVILNNKDRRQRGGYRKFSKLIRSDLKWTLDTTGDLAEHSEKFYKIAERIINKEYQKYQNEEKIKLKVQETGQASSDSYICP